MINTSDEGGPYFGIFVLFRKLSGALITCQRSYGARTRGFHTINNKCSQKWARPGMSSF